MIWDEFEWMRYKEKKNGRGSEGIKKYRKERGKRIEERDSGVKKHGKKRGGKVDGKKERKKEGV
jgi:hypothetical protein